MWDFLMTFLREWKGKKERRRDRALYVPEERGRKLGLVDAAGGKEGKGRGT